MALKIEDLRYPLSFRNLEGTPREIRMGRRDVSRMLVVDRESGDVIDSRVRDLPSWLKPGDVLVLNNSKRIPGVLRGRTEYGGQVELRFVDVNVEDALCSVFPTHDVREGSVISLPYGDAVTVLETELTAHNLARVRASNSSIRQLLKDQGTPIEGFFYENEWGCDELNPFYATVEGGVESPLAGLHFTPTLVNALRECGVEVCFVTLHSVGSWLPFLEDDVDDHQMWTEEFVVTESTAAVVNSALANGNTVCACGSTALRALESAAICGRQVEPTSGRTNLYITPGYEFRVCTNYFTNFHQYQTSLIVLDAAFAGVDLIKQAYTDAVNRRYSFFEFGDAVLLR